jgi:mannitol/fructose-specific phosphotransferase system IIA component (Ntr-type)
MTILSNLQFDLCLAHVKVQSEKKLLQVLSSEVSALCGMDDAAFCDIFEQNENSVIVGAGEGVAVLDLRHALVKRPLLVLMTLDQPVDLRTSEARGVDIIAAVLSPESYGPLHLQRLAGVTRLLRNMPLCAALREARDADSMVVLFSSESRMIAA